MLMLLSLWRLIKENALIRDYIFALPAPNYDYGCYQDWWFRIAQAFILETKRYRYSTTRCNTGAMAESMIEDMKAEIVQWK